MLLYGLVSIVGIWYGEGYKEKTCCAKVVLTCEECIVIVSKEGDDGEKRSSLLILQ